MSRRLACSLALAFASMAGLAAEPPCSPARIDRIYRRNGWLDDAFRLGYGIYLVDSQGGKSYYDGASTYYYKGSPSIVFYKTEVSNLEWYGANALLYKEGRQSVVFGVEESKDKDYSRSPALDGASRAVLDCYFFEWGWNLHCSLDLSLARDESAPDMSPVAFSWHRGAASLGFPTAVDPGVGIDAGSYSYSKAGEGHVSVSDPAKFSYSFQTEGIHELRFYVSDLLENKSELVAKIGIDWTPPDLEPSADIAFARWSNKASALVGCAVRDPLSGPRDASASVDNGAWASLATPITIKKEGKSIIRVKASDNAGNEASTTREIWLDRGLPEIKAPFPLGATESGATIRSSAEFNASASDALSGIDADSLYHRIGSSPQARGWPSALPQGRYLLELGCKDLAGNQACLSGWVCVDAEPPAIGLLVSPAYQAGAYSKEPSLTVAALCEDALSGIASLAYSIDGGSPMPYAGPLTVNKEGSTRVLFKAIDRAGNSVLKEIELLLDRERPSMSIEPALGPSEDEATALGNSAFSARAVDALSGIDDGSLKHRFGEGPWIPGFPRALPEGRWRLSLSCADAAGNERLLSGWFCVDTEAPRGRFVPSAGLLPATWSSSSEASVSVEAFDALSGIDAEASFAFVSLEGLGERRVALNAPITLMEGANALRYMLRDKAGNSASGSALFLIDRTGPAVSRASIEAFNHGDSVSCSLDGCFDGGVGLGGARIEYSIAPEAESPSHWVPGPMVASLPASLEASVAWLGEGPMSLYVRLRDSLGNAGQAVRMSFGIDRTAPSVTGFVVRGGQEGEELLNLSRPISSESFCIECSAVDTGIMPSGAHRSILGRGENPASALADLARGGTPFDAATPIDAGPDGAHWLALAALDRAGNRSEPMLATYRVNRAIPALPIIRSPSHGYARSDSDASSLDRASFQVDARSGAPIAGYEWAIARRSFSEQGSSIDEALREARSSGFMAAGTLASSITLDPLPSNIIGESWLFIVRGVSASGLPGPWGSYPFKIDPDMPGPFELLAPGLSSSPSGYPYAPAGGFAVEWPAPEDEGSGIKGYSWRLASLDSQGLEVGVGSSKSLPSSARSVFVPSLPSGAYRLKVEAIDLAGNAREKALDFRFDSEAPQIEGDIQVATAALEASDLVAVMASLPYAADAESGVAWSGWRLSAADGRELASGPRPGNAVEPFELAYARRGEACVLEFSAVDASGNRSSLRAAFTADLPPRANQGSWLERYEDAAHGYSLHGMIARSLDGYEASELNKLAIAFPSCLEPRLGQEPVGDVAFDTIEPSLEGIRLAERLFADTEPLTLSTASGGFSCGSISFSHASGLMLHDARPLALLALIDAFESPLRFDWLKLEGAPLFAASASSRIEGPLNMGAGTLPIHELLGLRYEDSGLRAERALVELASGTYGLLSGGAPARVLEARDLVLDARGVLIEARLDAGLSFEWGGLVIQIEGASIRGQEIIVERGRCILPPGASPATVPIGGIALDPKGAARALPSFSMGSFSLRLAGRDYRASPLAGSGGALLFELDSDEADAPPITGTVCLRTGVAPEARSAGFMFEVGDFSLEALEAVAWTGGMRILEARLASEPGSLPGSREARFEGFELDAGSMRAEGSGKASQPLAARLSYNAHGGDIWLHDAALSQEGIRGRLEFSTPFGELSIVRIHGALFSADGECSLPDEDVEGIGSLHGYPVSIRARLVEQARFEGEACLDPLLPGLGSLSLQASWDGAGFITRPLSATGLSFEADGISFELEAPYSGEEGIMARAFARAGGLSAEFPRFRLVAGKGFLAGSGSGSLRIGPYSVRLDEAILEGVRVEARVGALELPSFSGAASLSLDPFAFEAGKEASLRLAGSGKAAYADQAGFLVLPRSWELRDGVVQADGGIGFPPSFAAGTIECPGGYQIGPDGFPRSLEPIESVSFMAHGIECVGSLASVEGGVLRFGSVRAKAGSFAATLPAASIEPASGVLIFDESLELKLGGFSVRASSLSICDEGIIGSGALILPSALGIEPMPLGVFGIDRSGAIFADLCLPPIKVSGEAWSLEIEGLRLGRAGLSASRVEFGFTLGSDRVKAKLERAMILPDGSIASAALSATPFKAGGFEISLASLEFGSDGVRASGSVRLPLDLPGDASGLLVSLGDLWIDRGGRLKSFSVILEKRFSLPLKDAGLAVFCANPALSYANGRFSLSMAKAGLELPPSLGGGVIACEGLSLDLATGAFDFRAFTIEETRIALGESALTLTRVAMSSAGGLFFSGYLDLPQGLPSSISAKRLAVHELALDPSGSIERVSASLSGIAGPLMEGLAIIDGSLSARYGAGESFGLSLAGRVVANGSAMPEWLRGASLDIIDCLVLPLEGRIASLRARAEGLRADLGGLGSLEGLSLVVDTLSPSGGIRIGAGATLVLGGSCPEGIRAARIPFSMEVDTAYGITAIDAGIDLKGRYELGKALYLLDPRFSVKLSEELRLSIRASAGLELGESMPEGLRGLRASLERFEIDDRGRIKDIAASLSIKDGPLFQGVETRGARLGLSMRNGMPVFSLQGDLALASRSGGIDEVRLLCERLEIGLDGALLGLSAGCAVKDTLLADGLRIKRGSLVAGLGENEILVACEGSLALEAPFPEALRSARLRINGASFSTRRGFIAFSAGLEDKLEWKPFAGIVVSLDTLDIGNEGITLGASARLSSPMPEGLEGLAVGVKRLAIDWSGNITAFEAGVLEARARVWGFNVGLKDLFVDSRGVKAAKAWIDLPPELGAASLAFSQAGFTWGGAFYGNPEASEIKGEISGFSISLKGAERSGDVIRFREAAMTAPDFLGKARLSLVNPSLSPRGLELDGAEFTLPGFMIGEGVGFSDVVVKFARRGASWTIEGKAACFIPGIGNVRAELSFVAADPSYPIGLKRAYLEYEATGFGIALGSSGLYVSGLRGLFEYGPPGSTIPPELLPFMASSKGPRMQLGLSLVDIASRGGLARFKIDAWVDVHELVFAIKGAASFANGLIDASALAVFSRNCFAADLYFSISLIEGRVSAYFFERNGRSYFSGRASLTVKIPQGILFGFLPFSELRLPDVGAEFGVFTLDGRERRGASFFVDIPIAGKVGAFYSFDSGSIEFPDLARLKLVSPFALGDASEPRLAAVEGGPSTFLLRVEGSRRLIVLSDRPGDELTLIGPDGAVFKEGAACAESIRSATACVLAVDAPENGLWKLVRRSGGEDGLVALGARQMPRASIEEAGLPAVARAPFIARARLEGGAGLRAALYLLPIGSGERGLGFPIERLAGECVADAQGRLEFKIDPSAFQGGLYLMELRPLDACAFESLRSAKTLEVRPALALRAPSNFSVSKEGSSGIRYSFDNIEGGRAQSYELGWLRGEASGTIKLGQSVRGKVSLPEEAIGGAYRVRAIDERDRPGLWSESLRATSPASFYRFDKTSVELTMPRGEERLVSLAYSAIDPRSELPPAPRLEWGADAPIGSLVRIEAGKGRGTMLIAISAPNEMALGAYSLPIHLDGAEPCVLRVNVRAAPPRIESLSPQIIEYPGGGVLRVNGGPFGPELRVFLDGSEIAYLDRGAHFLHVALPEGLLPGSHRISASSGEGASEALFTVARQRIHAGSGAGRGEAGFAIIVEENDEALYAGSAVEILASIAGLKGHTASIRGLVPGMRCEPEAIKIQGDQAIGFKLHAAVSVAPGTYQLELVASGPTCEYVAPFRVRLVDSPLRVLPAAFADALVGDSLSARLVLEGSGQDSGEARFKLLEGSLPVGIELAEAGLLSGKFEAPGLYRFVVQALDPAGREAKAEYAISVRDRQRASPLALVERGSATSAPARSGPSVARYVEEAACGFLAEALALHDRLIIAYGAAGIAAFDAVSLAPLWTTTAGAIKVDFAEGKILALDRSGFLSAYDARCGDLRWKREGIEDFALSGDFLFAYDGNRYLVIDPSDSRLLELRGAASIQLPERSRGAQLAFGRYMVDEGGIYLINEAENQRSLLIEGEFACIEAQSDSLLAFDSRGFLCRISGPANADGPRIEHGFYGKEGGVWLGSGSKIALRAIDREGLSAAIELSIDGSPVTSHPRAIEIEPLDGTHEYLARAIDDEGAYGPPLALMISMDRDSPLLEARLIECEGELDSKWVIIEASDAGSGVEGCAWSLYREEALEARGCAGMKVKISAGASYRLEAYAYDHAGNRAAQQYFFEGNEKRE
jgi:hypothetical protein